MRYLLLVALLVSTASASAVEVKLFKFTCEERASLMPGTTGCWDAEDCALDAAESFCYEAGYTECEEVETVVLKKRRTRMMFWTRDPRDTTIRRGFCRVMGVVAGQN